MDIYRMNRQSRKSGGREEKIYLLGCKKYTLAALGPLANARQRSAGRLASWSRLRELLAVELDDRFLRRLGRSASAAISTF